jgi:hypothetical protein
MGMTSAERQRRYLERLKVKAVNQITDNQILEVLCMRPELVAKAARGKPASREITGGAKSKTDPREGQHIRKLEAELGRVLSKPMPPETFKAIAKALHADKKPTEEDRATAHKLFNAWLDDMKKRVRR